MTYNVFSGTLNPTQSVSSAIAERPCDACSTSNRKPVKNCVYLYSTKLSKRRAVSAIAELLVKDEFPESEQTGCTRSTSKL